MGCKGREVGGKERSAPEAYYRSHELFHVETDGSKLGDEEHIQSIGS